MVSEVRKDVLSVEREVVKDVMNVEREVVKDVKLLESTLEKDLVSFSRGFTVTKDQVTHAPFDLGVRGG